MKLFNNRRIEKHIIYTYSPMTEEFTVTAITVFSFLLIGWVGRGGTLFWATIINTIVVIIVITITVRLRTYCRRTNADIVGCRWKLNRVHTHTAHVLVNDTLREHMIGPIVIAMVTSWMCTRSQFGLGLRSWIRWRVVMVWKIYWKYKKKCQLS